ncbi:MAG: hypothetical protein IT270_18630 [Saprospiraceae bacterium]|nr:hypothetical protein [Saprospiraceae bacterium]
MLFFGKKYLSLYVSLFVVYTGLNAQIRTVPNQNPQQPPPQQREVEEEAPRQQQSSAGFTDFKSHLWYGGGVSLGFGASNGGSSFGFGLSPMVGYKIIEQISVGPRLNVYFSSYKEQGYETLNLFNTELGAFLRGRVFRGLFIQGEISNEWGQEPYYAAPPKYEKVGYQRFNQYLGGGYNFGNGMGGFGSEIGIFYNFAVGSDINSYENPWDYRFVFTWRF